MRVRPAVVVKAAPAAAASIEELQKKFGALGRLILLNATTRQLV